MSAAVLTAVDHIVIHVSDLDVAADIYRRLGFTVTNASSGHTYLLFGDFHVELRELTEHSDREGPHAIALRCDDIDAEIARLRDVGIVTTDPVDDPITFGDSSLLRRIAEVDAFIPLRLVETGYGSEAMYDLLGHPEPHPNTATVLERTYVAVASIDRDLTAFENALGLTAPEPEMGTVIMSMMSVFYVGEAGIAVAEPRGAGPTADALAARGPGIFQVLFRAGHLDEAERFMVDHGFPAPARGTRLSGESALLVLPENACGIFVAMAGNA